MKTLVGFLLIIVWNSHNVKSLDFLDKVGLKIKYFAESFIATMKSISNKLSTLVIHRLKDKIITSKEIKQYIADKKTRRAFNDIIVEETTENSEAEALGFKVKPIAAMTMLQLANNHGKRIESHVVITGDGYILTVHRLMKPLDQPLSSKLLNPAVLLHHGLLGSSADWILLGPNKSLPYILSNIGYDVWMTNSRGNYYSRDHVTRNVNSSQFWNFSWQEMGEYDLPAVVDYIRKIKNSNDTIDYVGHSMGATALLVFLSTTPVYNKYFRMGILLAPLAYLSNIQGPLRIITSWAMNLPKDSFNILGKGEFFSSNKIPTWIVKKYCTSVHLYCSNPLFFLSGISRTDSWNSSLVATIVNHVPAGGSTKTILHYARLVKTGKFQKFGEDTDFPLKKVTLPIALFSSSDDWLATIPDVLKLYLSISNPIDHHIIRGKNLSHTEFVFGPDADALVFNKVIEILERGATDNIATLNEV